MITPTVMAKVCFGLVLVLMLIADAKGQRRNQDEETFSGSVVATDRIPGPCVSKSCSMQLFVKLERNKSRRPTYALIHVAYIESEQVGLVERLAKGGRWEFTAVREGSATLQQYVHVEDDNGRDISSKAKISAWNFSRGRNVEALPFGKPIPSYTADIGKFKRIDK